MDRKWKDMKIYAIIPKAYHGVQNEFYFQKMVIAIFNKMSSTTMHV